MPHRKSRSCRWRQPCAHNRRCRPRRHRRSHQSRPRVPYQRFRAPRRSSEHPQCPPHRRCCPRNQRHCPHCPPCHCPPYRCPPCHCHSPRCYRRNSRCRYCSPRLPPITLEIPIDSQSFSRFYHEPSDVLGVMPKAARHWVCDGHEICTDEGVPHEQRRASMSKRSNSVCADEGVPHRLASMLKRSNSIRQLGFYSARVRAGRRRAQPRSV
jgi:hypothetical protein